MTEIIFLVIVMCWLFASAHRLPFESPPNEFLERVRWPGCPHCFTIHESDEDDRICSEVRRNFLAARITHLPMYHLQAREPVCCWCLGKHETEEDDQACLTLRSLLEDDQQE